MLEAIFLHEGAHNAGLVLSVENLRGIENFNKKDFLSDLFTGFKTEKEILLEADYQEGRSLSLRIIQEKNKQAMPVDMRGIETEGTAIITPTLIFEVRGNKKIFFVFRTFELS